MGGRVLITDIQKFCVNDGPGFRTNVYVKGCPLRCAWCHNPETIDTRPELYWKRRLCVQCGECLTACPKDAILPPIDPALAQAEGSHYHKVDRKRCDLCMECVTACSYGALEAVGKSMTVDEILDVVEQDRPFYENSGGGMTLTGGEPTMFPEFSESLLAGSGKRGLHNCLDTNGYCAWESLERLLPYADILLFDVKHLDPAAHQRMTGADNARILQNLEKLTRTGKEVWIRVPVVPGFNDSIEFHQALARHLASLPGRVARVDLLPFHNWCQDKYGWLGVEWPLGETEAMDPGMLEIPVDLYRYAGLKASIGGSGFESTGTE
ncbi:MAG: glycyl-radical enzyme activating protein [Proteobacteria bacterium]|nr:glycyl-radical enzyme activating protein [Pseudomonadota bacterium]